VVALSDVNENNYMRIALYNDNREGAKSKVIENNDNTKRRYEQYDELERIIHTPKQLGKPDAAISYIYLSTFTSLSPSTVAVNCFFVVSIFPNDTVGLHMFRSARDSGNIFLFMILPAPEWMSTI
jgi:hypothetical protein